MIPYNLIPCYKKNLDLDPPPCRRLDLVWRRDVGPYGHGGQEREDAPRHRRAVRRGMQLQVTCFLYIFIWHDYTDKIQQ